MEFRLKLLITIAAISGVVFTVGGWFSDYLFPLMGWASNAGFGFAQKGMLVWGLLNIVIAIYSIHDWFKEN